jgi:hypothetical protein
MKYRKKPVVIEAMQLTETNMLDVISWINKDSPPSDKSVVLQDNSTNSIIIRTLEGNMAAVVGDWIIKGVMGEYYPCRNDIFQATYSQAE